MDPLFPVLPEDLTKLTDAELQALEDEHLQAAKLIQAEDENFLGELTSEQIIEQYKAGADQLDTIRAEKDSRIEAEANYATAKAEVEERIFAKAEVSEDDEAEADGKEADGEDAGEEADGEAAEGEGEAEASAEEVEVAEERELVLADGAADPDPAPAEPIRLRRPPSPSPERMVVSETTEKLSFVASGLVPSTLPGAKLETVDDIAEAMSKTARALGAPSHHSGGREDRHMVASLDYKANFPEERSLGRDATSNSEKIRAIGSPYFGKQELDVLIASGGLCAPAQPIYTMPQLATDARPVRGALPSFRAERGAISVPTPTTMGDADEAITVIEESDDALGGTFATKACLDLSCPQYTDTAVTIISHCREYGNLNAMSWPEKIRHENELTMAEHARVAEGYLLDRIKALSINVTIGAETLSLFSYITEAVVKAAFGIRSRLRMPAEARFVLLAPRVLADEMLVDTISTLDGNRFTRRGALEAYLSDAGVDLTYYLDTASSGDSQIADSAQTAAAIDGFPNNIAMALFPAGTFLHLDMGELNLGIVRDSTLNSTNDFQIFGEVFENVARIGPAQAAYWIDADVCPVGGLAPAGTARTCE